jgi:F0F1-type ATP synthase assembly protein I
VGIWQLVTLGGTLLGSLVGGLVIGLLVDRGTHTTPVFTLVGLGVGMVCGGLVGYVRVRGFLKDGEGDGGGTSA